MRAAISSQSYARTVSAPKREPPVRLHWITVSTFDASGWEPDILGGDYQHRVVRLGADPDGEGDVVATVVRHAPSARLVTGRDAILHVHGFTDYFFQRHLAERVAASGHPFYAVDLRKCGRSRRPGHTPHFVADLAHYDADLEAALAVVREDGHRRVIVMGHSTGGLVLPLWLDRRRRPAASTPAPGIELGGLVLNSPWFDLQVPDRLRFAAKGVARSLGRIRSRAVLPLPKGDAYGAGMHASRNGEWDYDLDWKPLTGFPITAGWLRAVLAGQAALHRGLDVGVPSLVLRSGRSHFARHYSAAADHADVVLSVDHIARWSGNLGGRVTSVPVEGARHDVFCSLPGPRERAFGELENWLAGVSTPGTPTASPTERPT